MKRSIVGFFHVLVAVMLAATPAPAQQLVHSFNAAAAHSAVIHQAEHSAFTNSARPHFNSSAFDSAGSHSATHVNTFHPTTFSHPSNAFSAHFGGSSLDGAGTHSTTHISTVHPSTLGHSSGAFSTHFGAPKAASSIHTQPSHFVAPTKTAVVRDAGTTRVASPFSKEKQALVDMAKIDKRRGISAADMQAYKELNAGLDKPFPTKMVRGPERSVRPGAGPHSKEWHGRVGPVNHIPIRGVKN